MIILKKAVVTVLLVFLALFPVPAQEDLSGITLEEDYPLESMSSFLIREQGQAMEREKKLASLEYIREAINRGDTGLEMQTALDKLALEGILNQTRENGRLANYPEVRTQAAIVLGEIGTPAASNTLITLIRVEFEPMVITEAILSLTKIGLTNKGARTISQTLNRFDMTIPDNRMAYAALDAFDTLAKKNNGKLDPYILSTILRIPEGRYRTEVRARARRLIVDLRQYN